MRPTVAERNLSGDRETAILEGAEVAAGDGGGRRRGGSAWGQARRHWLTRPLILNLILQIP